MPIETGIISLIDQVAAVNFVKNAKVAAFGTSEMLLIYPLNLSMNLNCCLMLYCVISDLSFNTFESCLMSTIHKIIPFPLALVVSLDSGLRVALSTTALYSARSASSSVI